MFAASRSISAPEAMRALRAWLDEKTPPPSGTNYRYRLFRTAEADDALIRELQIYAREAHRDALRRLESMLTDAMEPFPGAAGAEQRAHPKYPYGLHSITLQGYFGELLAAALVENAAPFGEQGWEVPAFRWRINVFDLYQALERFEKADTPIPAVFGAHGDDCTAFQLSDTGGYIRKYIVCECKCTTTHRAQLIADAHEQISKRDPTAMDIPQLIEVLRSGPEDAQLRWIPPLRRLYNRGYEPEVGAGARRHVLVYVHGQLPKLTTSWISPTAPHKGYSGTEPLEVFEVHIGEVASLIRDVYSEEPSWTN